MPPLFFCRKKYNSYYSRDVIYYIYRKENKMEQTNLLKERLCGLINDLALAIMPICVGIGVGIIAMAFDLIIIGLMILIIGCTAGGILLKYSIDNYFRP